MPFASTEILGVNGVMVGGQLTWQRIVKDYN